MPQRPTFGRQEKARNVRKGASFYVRLVRSEGLVTVSPRSTHFAYGVAMKAPEKQLRMRLAYRPGPRLQAATAATRNATSIASHRGLRPPSQPAAYPAYQTVAVTTSRPMLRLNALLGYSLASIAEQIRVRRRCRTEPTVEPTRGQRTSPALNAFLNTPFHKKGFLPS